jgi:hypothetical protein
MKTVYSWEVQELQPGGWWANPGNLNRGVCGGKKGETDTPEELAREIVEFYVPRRGVYRAAIWDTLGVGKPPILVATWNGDGTIDVRPYEALTVA